MSYADFLAAKASLDPPTGIADPSAVPAVLAAFQAAIVPWALRRGRAALFAGTGLGKTLMELAWAQAVSEHLGCAVLILTPLAVAAQFVAEGAKFGIPVRRVTRGDELEGARGVLVTNYDKLDRFDLSLLAGIVLDESSILKAFDGRTRNALIEGARRVPFRLAASATPAPNDFMELGNHAEFLGVMTHVEMLATFFIHDGGDTSKWRLKRHAERDFWRWVASWAVMLDKPSDLGFIDDGYVLPALRQHQHVVDDGAEAGEGLLFAMEARTMAERLAARRASIGARVEAGAALANSHDRPCVAWCNLNDESAALARSIPGAVEVRGADSEARKEAVLGDFAAGRLRVLVTKPSICGFGMNWQHCHDTVFVGLNDSFEQLYQAVRRFWRFGQRQAVDAHLIAARAEGAVVANLRRKEADAARMMAAMVEAMAEFSDINVTSIARERAPYEPRAMATPSFLEAA